MSSTPSAPRSSGVRSRGRGTAAAFGFLLLFAGLIGGGVLYVLSLRYHDDAVEAFARAGVGCTTTLEFSETGDFFVYQETIGEFEVPEGGCEPQATPGEPFGVRFVDPDTVVLVPDSTIEYDTEQFTGASVARFQISDPGNYELEVRGDDVSDRAAIGRDPSEGVSELRNRALIVGISGIVLGGLLLALAGRRSKKASTQSIPDGPGWGIRPGQGESAWPPAPPRVPQIPINPHQPDTPAAVAPPPPPLPARDPGAATPQRAAWAAPPAADGRVDMAPPELAPTAKPPDLPPTLPG